MRMDLRHAIRLLLSQPGFTAAVVLTLGLGIGASTAVYSLVDAVLLKPLPYPDAERIVMVSARRATGGEYGVSGGLLEALEKLPSIEHAAAVTITEQNLVSDGSLAIVRGAMVTSAFFDLFQTAPLLGRTPGPSPVGVNEIVLAEPLWRQRFAADPQIVGRTVRLDDRSFTVVGVMPRGFAHPEEASYWRSMTVSAGQRSQIGSGPYDGIARVARPGLQAARAEADVLSASLGMTTDGSPVTIAITPLLETMTAVHRRTLMYALTAVGVVLLIACGNAAHLLLARTSGRARELAVRSALGAARFRLVRQLLTEAALIAAVSCVAGVLVAALLMRLIPFIGMTEMPRLATATLDARLLTFAVAVSTASVLLIGLVPAWLASRTGESLATNRSTAPKTARRAAWVIVAGEAALTLMLLVGGGLAAVTLLRTLSVDLGFDTSSLSLVTLRPTAKYSGAARSEYHDRVAGLVREAAGVEAVAVVSHIPLGRFLAERASVATDGGVVVAEGRAGPRARTMAPGSFAALGVPILRGREFVAADREGGPRVAVVNATLAARLWPGEDAVGKSVRAPAFTRPGTETYTVVGVVGDFRGSLVSAPSPELSRQLAPTAGADDVSRGAEPARPVGDRHARSRGDGVGRRGAASHGGRADVVALLGNDEVQPLSRVAAVQLCDSRVDAGGGRRAGDGRSRSGRENPRTGHSIGGRRNASATRAARDERRASTRDGRPGTGHHRLLQSVGDRRPFHRHRPLRDHGVRGGDDDGGPRRGGRGLRARAPGRAHRPDAGAAAGVVRDAQPQRRCRRSPRAPGSDPSRSALRSPMFSTRNVSGVRPHSPATSQPELAGCRL